MIKDVIETSFKDEKNVYRKLSLTILSIPNETMLLAELDGYDTDINGCSSMNLLFSIHEFEAHINYMLGLKSLSEYKLYIRFKGEYHNLYKDSDQERTLNNLTTVNIDDFNKEYNRFLEG